MATLRKPIYPVRKPMMFSISTPWRLIDTGFRDPYMNMAIDEALVQLTGPSSLPILRFFDWSKPAISIGYSQKMNDIMDVIKEGISIVRRPTGGGVVFHGNDITYSVILSKKFKLDIKDIYILIQSWIKTGLDKLGLITSQFKKANKGIPGYCSISPSYGDIMAGDSKLGGLAARRIRQKTLFQGYLDLNAKNINKEEIRKSIIENWHSKSIKTILTDAEEELAGNICENKYIQDRWNFVR